MLQLFQRHTRRKVCLCSEVSVSTPKATTRFAALIAAVVYCKGARKGVEGGRAGELGTGEGRDWGIGAFFPVAILNLCVESAMASRR